MKRQRRYILSQNQTKHILLLYIKMKNKIYALINSILLVATLVVNYLATSLPIWGMTTWQLSDLYPNLFVPAWFTFSIWWVIYLLLIWFVVRQLIDAFSKNWKEIAKTIGPWFAISCLANIWWIFAWHHKKIWISLIVMLIILISLIWLSQKIKTFFCSYSLKEKLFIKIPFAVYLGRISVATIANVATFLVDMGWNMFGMTDIFWTIVLIVVAALLAILALWKDKNIPFALVILWAFFGIAYKRISVDPVYATSILWTIVFCSVVVSGFVGWSVKKL